MKTFVMNKELISMSEEIFKKENIFTQHDVGNKQLKEENEELRKEENEKLRKEENEKLRKGENEKLRKEENKKLRKENEQLGKNKVAKDAEIKESIEKPKEMKNMTDSYPNGFNKNKYKKILAIIDSNKFGHKNKIGKFKYIDIKDLVNNIKNNAISEISAKKSLNTLTKIKNAEIIKYNDTPQDKNNY